MAEYTFNKEKNELILGDVCFKVTSVVRNELDNSRKLHDPFQIILSTPGPNGGARKPVMPRPFPNGRWRVTTVHHSEDPNYKPIVVETDAHQMLPVWALDSNGGYDHPTDELIDDYGYWFHHAWFKHNGVWVASHTTHGCGNIINLEDCERIFKIMCTGDYITVS
jgi:hypothetical protein